MSWISLIKLFLESVYDKILTTTTVCRWLCPLLDLQVQCYYNCATMSDSEHVVDGTCEDHTRNNTCHWVEDLFPPTFRLSLQELVHGSISTSMRDAHGRELAAESSTGDNSEELFAKCARRISPLDVGAIKNVYQRVWLMMQAYESAKGE